METIDNGKQEENTLMIQTELENKRPPPVVAKKPKPPVAKKPPVAQKPAHLSRSPSSLDDQNHTASSPPKVPPALPKVPPVGPGGTHNHVTPSCTPPTAKSRTPKQDNADGSNEKKTPPPLPRKLTNKEHAISNILESHNDALHSDSKTNGVCLPCVKNDDLHVPKVSPRRGSGASTSGSKGTTPPRTPPKRVKRNIQNNNSHTESSGLRNSPLQKLDSTDEHYEPETNEQTISGDKLRHVGEQDSNNIIEQSGAILDSTYKGPQRFNPFDKEPPDFSASEPDALRPNAQQKHLSNSTSHAENVNFTPAINEPVNNTGIKLSYISGENKVSTTGDSSVSLKNSQNELDNSDSVHDNKSSSQKNHIWQQKKVTEKGQSSEVTQNATDHQDETSKGDNSSLSVMSKIQMFLHKNDGKSNEQTNKQLNKSAENIKCLNGESEFKTRQKDWTNFFKNRKSKSEDVKSEQSFVSYISDDNVNCDNFNDLTDNTANQLCSRNSSEDFDSQSVSSFESGSDKSNQLNKELLNIFGKKSPIHCDVSDLDDCRRNSLPNFRTNRESCSPVNQSKSVPNKPLPVPRRLSPNRPRPVPRKRLSLSRQGSQSSISESSSDTKSETNSQKSESVSLCEKDLLASNIECSKPDVQVCVTKTSHCRISDIENSDTVYSNDQNTVAKQQISDDHKTDDSAKGYVHLKEDKKLGMEDSSKSQKSEFRGNDNKLEAISVKQLDTEKGEVEICEKNVKLKDKKMENVQDFEVRSLRDQPKAQSFDLSLLSGEPLMETSSLLDEIEQLVSRRLSELGPEFVCEFRMKSDPVPPPRSKRNIRRSLVDSSGADVRASDSSVLSNCGESFKGSNTSLDSTRDSGIPQAVSKKQCPPKPRRTKLINRSQSDVSGMKQLSLMRQDDFEINSQERSQETGQDDNLSQTSDQNNPPLPPRKHKQRSLTVDFCVPANQTALIRQIEINETRKSSPCDINMNRNKMQKLHGKNTENKDSDTESEKIEKIKKLRPTRKAPPPPVQGGNKLKKGDNTNGLSQSVPDISVGYTSIKGENGDKLYSVDHDYHEIPDEFAQKLQVQDYGSNLSLHDGAQHKEKSPTPPDLPPRNYNLSQSPPHQHIMEGRPMSEVSLISSSSNSGSIGSPEQDELTSSDSEGEDDEEKDESRRSLCERKFTAISEDIPKIVLPKSASSSILALLQERPPSCVSSISCSTVSSNCSGLSVCSFYQDDITSSESEKENEDDELQRKREKKVFFIANEIVSSERVFVDVLKLLNVDFRVHISQTAESLQRPVISNEILNKILNYLPQLQNFNEDLLHDLEHRISHWEEHKKVADIFVKKGPFLKLYTSYIKDFEEMTTTLDESCKKNPVFHASLKAFESSPRCASLAIKHYMLKPIQRIPQYKLLLKDYKKHLTSSSPDYEDTNSALSIVSEVADHANESMRYGDQVHKLLEIQRSLDGNFEVIKPGRVLLKQGELMKLSRKEMQPRVFFLFNDVLLYTTPMATGGYRLNNALTLAGMKVTKANLDEFKNEFNIISVQRSFTVEARTPEERDGWLDALNAAIDENAQRRGTFESVKAGMETSFLDKDFVLGSKAPIWVPDTRVTMCMNCTGEFTVTWRRHHCRACGRVVCANCSDNRAPLEYLRNKPARVCDDCFVKLQDDFDKKAGGASIELVPDNMDQDGSILSFSSLKERFQKIRRSARLGHKFNVHRPSRLREVHASDQGSSMSGNLKILKGRKWKKFWFVIKDKVLYTYKASADMAAIESMPILGYEVVRFTESFEGVQPALLFQLNHKNRPPVIFQTDSTNSTERWVKAMKDASVA